MTESPEIATRRAMGDGNCYKAHPLQIHSGEFWRCKHGNTGIGSGLKWIGCKRCAFGNPKQWLTWRFGWWCEPKPPEIVHCSCGNYEVGPKGEPHITVDGRERHGYNSCGYGDVGAFS